MNREQEESKIWVSGLATWVGGGTVCRGRIIRGGVKFFLVGRECGRWMVEDN